jgi:hypothetical protein
LNRSESQFRIFISLLVFALAMGYVEGVVVVYLKQLVSQQIPSLTERDIIFSLGLIVFIDRSILENARLALIERTREAATVIMLLAVALLSSPKLKRRTAAFFFVFSVWDLAYYATLHAWLGWPTSIWDLDVYFLIPVPWAGPVLTPIAASSIIGLISAWTLLRIA